MDDVLDRIDAVRVGEGFLSIAETIALGARGNVVLDPFSTLIGRDVRIGSGNRFHPNCVVACKPGASCTIGDENNFFSQTLIDAANGAIQIGSRNRFGPGGFAAISDRGSGSIAIGNDGRYTSGVQVFAHTGIGDGCQVHGAISVADCVLAGGADHAHPDPDLRGAVLKGYGTARKLSVGAGQVIAGEGRFEQSALRAQSYYHPKE